MGRQATDIRKYITGNLRAYFKLKLRHMTRQFQFIFH